MIAEVGISVSDAHKVVAVFLGVCVVCAFVCVCVYTKEVVFRYIDCECAQKKKSNKITEV